MASCLELFESCLEYIWGLSGSCLGAVWDLCGAVWEKIEKTVQETLVWLDKNQLSEKDYFEAKLKVFLGFF